MQKIIFIFTILLNFVFSDILLDRINTESYKVCPISKENRKRFFLMEIRKVKKLNKTAIYIFEKQKYKKYKFIYGFYLDFLGKRVYFSSHKNYNKKEDSKKTYLYWCKPKTEYESGNFVMLIGGELSKEEINSAINKWRVEHNNPDVKRRKNFFYAKGRILLFIPENKERKGFFTTLKPPYSPLKWIKKDMKKNVYKIPEAGYFFGGSFTLSLNSYQKGEVNKIIGLTPEQRKFRDKYFISLADLQKQGIAEPTPMWDAKVKPYKNVFGEELLD